MKLIHVDINGNIDENYVQENFEETRIYDNSLIFNVEIEIISSHDRR